MKQFKRSRIILFSLFFACLILLTLSFYLIQHRPFDSRVLPVRFMIGDRVGIEINDSALTFGRALPGTTLYRGIFVDNPHAFSINVRVFINKTIASYVFAPNATFTLSSGARYEVPFVLAVPSGSEAGNYSGTVLFEFWK
ncbi:MAG TPA: hypothetical protein VJK07_01490 [Candidatus Nanoarchaeia archaeon]|nr:hypothetical protein [Candidatus Nanoarchaeia archaeon]